MATEFTPTFSLMGGLIIGGAVLMLLWFNNKIAGISGIIKGSIGAGSGDLAWRIYFMTGLFLGGLVFSLFWEEQTARNYILGYPLMIIAGALVGFGTALGNGCTSGHGICGMSRLSRRSIVATLLFMGFAMGTLFVFRHLLGVS